MVAGKVRTKLDTSGELVVYSEAAVRNNAAIVEYCRTSMAALSGGTAGLLGLTGFYGFGFYMFAVLGLWVLLLIKAGPQWKKYFINRKSLLTNGFFGGLFTYVLFWTVLYVSFQVHHVNGHLIYNSFNRSQRKKRYEMFLIQVNKKKLLVSFIIAGVALVGDRNSENQNNRLAAAICDNLTHGVIGAFTWIGMFVSRTSLSNLQFLFEIALCGTFSSIMDLDHFVAAKSIHLKDAVSLKNRPPMHCTTLIAFTVVSVLCTSHWLKSDWLYKFGWILAAAFFSHHIRDSKRRGFWLWPLGSTTPTPNFVYILAQMLLPHAFSKIMSEFAPSTFLEKPLANIYSV